MVLKLAFQQNRLPPLQTLQTFSVVAETGSFTLAASELNLSQSAISRQIQQLEYYFGCSLFQRHTRKVVLTEQGEAIVPIVNGLLISLRNSFEATRTRGRSLTVRMPPTFARRWLLPRLTDLHGRHPGLNITIDTAWFARPTFGTGDIDLLVLYGNGHWPGMHVELLLPEKLTPMCSPSFATSLGNPARIESLADCVLLHSNARQSDWTLWLQAEGAYDLTAVRNQIFDTQDFAMTAAASGYGVTMGDMHLARQDLESGTLVTPFRRIIESGYGYYAICPAREDAKARVSDLLNWLVRERPT
ncbi:LysR family transcriptional regulator [Mesorhizobium sp. CO1-1-11]|uniref:LysR substrate-binding domain-containing protein n=1 Tax=Mesorhizobium sp. CO1-1-11 TaxID=2876636 RepID=UPI001CCD26F4|nr:LysR substrate-binding domain-containing protein [Mesorhizobium sp. CO1-1-11]MBZ9728039.1 LysR family transcriptional regulator [Mesorhizobium sp. CO1-1-11]